MSPEFMHLRAQHSAKLLADDNSISFEELLKYKHSTLMLLFDRVKDDLAAAVAKHGSERAKKAMAILDRWDGRADAGSRGAVLFSFWISAWAKDIDTIFASKWTPANPLLTPMAMCTDSIMETWTCRLTAHPVTTATVRFGSCTLSQRKTSCRA
jgi:acyl-homoserine-lactone acylase